MIRHAHECSIENCPVFLIIDLAEKKWALRILKEINGGNSHFNQLKRNLHGITAAVLSKRLKELEGKKLILRKVLNQNPAEVEYGLGKSAEMLVECWEQHVPLTATARVWT